MPLEDPVQASICAPYVFTDRIGVVEGEKRTEDFSPATGRNALDRLCPGRKLRPEAGVDSIEVSTVTLIGNKDGKEFLKSDQDAVRIFEH